MHNWMTWQTTTTARFEDVSWKTFLSNSLHASQAIRRAILHPQAFYFVRLTAFRVIKNSPLIRQPSAILVIFVWIREQWTQMAHLLHMRKWSKEKFWIPKMTRSHSLQQSASYRDQNAQVQWKRNNYLPKLFTYAIIFMLFNIINSPLENNKSAVIVAADGDETCSHSEWERERDLIASTFRIVGHWNDNNNHIAPIQQQNPFRYNESERFPLSRLLRIG